MCVLLAALFFLPCASGLALDHVSISKKNIAKLLPIGEKLTYTIRWTGVPAGKTVIENKGIVKIDGHDCFRITSRTRSNSFVSVFYPVDDVVETYIDCEKMVSRKFVKKLKEGKRTRDKYTEFKIEEGMAYHYSIRDNGTYGLDAKSKLTKPTQDALSSLFFFRTFKKFDAKDKMSMVVNADEKNWEMKINVNKKGKVKLWGKGKFHAFEVQPKASFEGIFIRKGEMRIWLDENWAIPMKMKVDIPIGAIVVTLSAAEKTNLYTR